LQQEGAIILACTFQLLLQAGVGGFSSGL